MGLQSRFAKAFNPGCATGTNYARLKGPPLVAVAYELRLKARPRGRQASVGAEDLQSRFSWPTATKGLTRQVQCFSPPKSGFFLICSVLFLLYFILCFILILKQVQGFSPPTHILRYYIHAYEISNKKNSRGICNIYSISGDHIQLRTSFHTQFYGIRSSTSSVQCSPLGWRTSLTKNPAISS